MKEIWLRLSGAFACKLPCSKCHELYGMKDCPCDKPVSSETVFEFIGKVNQRLVGKPYELSEDELIDIILSELNE